MQQSENDPRCDHAVSDAPPQKTGPVSSGSDSVLFLGGGRGAGCRGHRRVVRGLLRAPTFIQQGIVCVIELLQSRRVVIDAHRRQRSRHLFLHLRPHLLSLAQNAPGV